MFSKKLLILLKTPTRQFSSKRIGIIGVPFNKGQTKPGVSLGPKAIRAGGLIGEIKSISDKIDVKDFGDITYEKIVSSKPPVNMKQFDEVAGCNKSLSKKIGEILNDNRMCITLGGDHSIGVGTVDGHLNYRSDIVVFWVDAHPDLNVNTSSPTGNVHGMPVTLVTKELANFWTDMPQLDWLKPRMSIKNFVYIGVRSIDPFERETIKKFGIQAYGMREIQKYGIEKVMEMALEKVDPNKTKSIHCSFDIDGLDVLEAPSTGTPVRGGLSLREGLYIVEELEKTGRLDAIDLVEVNPTIGTPEDVTKTVEAAILVLKAACGDKRWGNIPN